MIVFYCPIVKKEFGKLTLKKLLSQISYEEQSVHKVWDDLLIHQLAKLYLINEATYAITSMNIEP